MSLIEKILPKQFGKMPSGERLKRIQQSPNYRNGAFQNQSHTPDLTDGATYFSVLKEILFGKHKNVKPSVPIPSIKTNLHQLNSNEDVLIWFGHSSYFMQIKGKRILVDPVLCGYASPFSFTTKAFEGADIYKHFDIPEIDILFITHDHYDHLDYKTIVALEPKIKQVICSLGTGEHLEYWGYEATKIHEMDWHQSFKVDADFMVHTMPSRHFSGRGFKRNQALWTSFILETAGMRLFIGGDSGYDKHFAEIGEKHGPFDLAIIENGQYNKSWKHIHLMPHEILQAAKELKANRIFPVHSSKFALGIHAWHQPLELIHENNKKEGLSLITPMIGEVVYLGKPMQEFNTWWKETN